MESGYFKGFFRNAPFDKPGVLRGFRGFCAPFFRTPPYSLVKEGFEDYPGVRRQEPRRVGLALIYGMLDRQFFIFFVCPVFSLQNTLSTVRRIS
jgi:hypothetical protein